MMAKASGSEYIGSCEYDTQEVEGAAVWQYF